jgi:hypothetical protein
MKKILPVVSSLMQYSPFRFADTECLSSGVAAGKDGGVKRDAAVSMGLQLQDGWDSK